MLFKNNQDGKSSLKKNVSYTKLFSFLNPSFPYLPMNHGYDLKTNPLFADAGFQFTVRLRLWCHSAPSWVSSQLSAKLRTLLYPTALGPWLWPSGQHSSLANLQSPCRESQLEDQLMQAVMWRWVHWGQNPSLLSWQRPLLGHQMSRAFSHSWAISPGLPHTWPCLCLAAEALRYLPGCEHASLFKYGRT